MSKVFEADCIITEFISTGAERGLIGLKLHFVPPDAADLEILENNVVNEKDYERFMDFWAASDYNFHFVLSAEKKP